MVPNWSETCKFPSFFGGDTVSRCIDSDTGTIPGGVDAAEEFAIGKEMNGGATVKEDQLGSMWGCTS